MIKYLILKLMEWIIIKFLKFYKCFNNIYFLNIKQRLNETFSTRYTSYSLAWQ